jgi:hypothetical protein
MSPDRALRRKNVEKIATDSVTSDEINAQRAELTAAERKLARMDQGIAKIREKVARLRQRLADARHQGRQRNTAQTGRAVTTASDKLDNARQQRDKMLSEYRELQLIVRDQRTLVDSLEKKEAARQKAVARFLKEWERNYDREMRMKEKTLRKRRRLLET